MTAMLLDWRRRRRWKRAAPGPFREFLARPCPRPSLDYRQAEYVAVDLETTGLDPRRDQILSLGWVVLRGPRIELASARHEVVRVQGAIPANTAVIHQITDDDAAAGGDLANALAALLADLAGRVLIAHHCHVELGFLGAACQRLYGGGLLVRAIDTQDIARRTLERRQTPFKASDLRLYALGERYNLPRYGAHNALADALAAAELFLAQAAYRDGGRGIALRELLY